MSDVSGVDYALTRGPYRADIASVGAALRTLRHDERDLVVGYPAAQVRPSYEGAVLAPWPNRVRDGRWTSEGATQQLPINEPARNCALHGLVLWHDWHADMVADDRVTLTTRLAAQTGYPFTLDLAMTWTLRPDGLLAELVVTNTGDTIAPYGCGFHPYLTVPGQRLDDCVLHLPAARRVEVDDRLLPLGPPSDVPPDADFRVARAIGTTAIDHAYSGIDFDTDGRAGASLVGPDGRGAAITFGPDTPFLHVCTDDDPGTPQVRRGVALEPTTCPPNALASGDGLVLLDPDDTHRVWFTIGAVGGQ